MSPLNLLAMASGLFKSKPFYCSIVSILVFLTAMQINNMYIQQEMARLNAHFNQEIKQLEVKSNRDIMQARIEYPWRIINYALQGASSHDEVMNEVRKWFKLNWGAQIEGVYIICHYDRKRFLKILNEDEVATICRMSN